MNLGCSKNQVDLENLIGISLDEGFGIANTPEESDAIIVNTCGFIEPAVSEAIETILEMASYKNENRKLIVSGCMTERYKNEVLKEIPEIDFITGVGKLENILSYLKRKKIEKNNQSRYLLTSPYFAYVKISEGCNNRCSYCTIPSIRGNLKSRKKEEILDEITTLLNQGIKEIILVSQDTTKYGIDIYGTPKLTELLNDICKLDGKFYIRLLYLNPDGVNRELIDIVKNEDKIIKYFEIPVQHISDKILKSMNRKSNSQKIKEVFEFIRKNISDAIIRTTFIIGFPGETEDDFNKIQIFMEKYKPDFAGFFPFYKEEGVKASEMEGQISKSVIRSRINKLQKVQKKITSEKIKSLKKNIITCFVDKSNEDFNFILEGRALFQSPEIDGKAYFIDGIADKGFGPYKCKIQRFVYPDIYCKIIDSE